MENNKYMQFNCPECGAPLEVYYEGPVEEGSFCSDEGRSLIIRHCKKCLRDWENYWFETMGESQLKRKFWG